MYIFACIFQCFPQLQPKLFGSGSINTHRRRRPPWKKKADQKARLPYSSRR
ncbi:unnamed protein product [Chondrus crispus]|uniref:Uncharacterized protein n=1 Tax=Chondrus crispus TaxID=2769 RepID=R7QFZ3_CHOCR|nr:unnamed protein product [Chondrus crispus]CDF36345.1 unnamed protein product [Chondrus crispus]|eukprot:XP_005716164.1 unnamed protein product [Chondrus crispus]